MKDFKRDILQEASLKNSPYSVPEGYFESLKERAVKYSKPAEVAPMQFRRILWTAISMAAMFIIMVTPQTAELEPIVYYFDEIHGRSDADFALYSAGNILCILEPLSGFQSERRKISYVYFAVILDIGGLRSSG